MGNVRELIEVVRLDWVVRVYALGLDAVLEHSGEVQVVFGQELHAFDFADHHIIEAGRESAGTDVEIVDVRDVDSVDEFEGGDSELDDAEVEGGFFDALVELEVVGEGALDAAELGDEAGELAVESDKVGVGDVLKDLREEFCEVFAVDLHDYS